jgi:hypothetical protein
VYCDETGTSGLPCYGFGSLWAPWERRGDLSGFIGDAKEQWFDQELKWSGVKKSSLPMYRWLVEQFFQRPSLAFHCLLVNRKDVNIKFHARGRQEAMQKHYTLLLANKMKASAEAQPDRRFRIRVDDLPFGYKKAGEVMGIVANHLTREFDDRGLVADIVEVDSKTSAGIQLCDVLLGAVASAWQGTPVNPQKKELRSWIAEHLGWRDLHADTYRHEKKFNIWMFHPRGKKIRRAKSRRVNLMYPSIPRYIGK